MEEIINAIVPPTLEEEIYDLSDVEKGNSDLIRVEMNIIEFPLFTKNKKIQMNQGMKYVFDSDKNKYLEVTPVLNGKIPLEYDENIFYALLRIYKKQNLNKKIFFDWGHLLSEANLKYTGGNLEKTREALIRMTKTFYTFHNTFYSNPDGRVLSDEIRTTMFSSRVISFTEAQESREDLLMYFKNKKVKEIVEVTFSDYFYQNIIRKGFIYFDSKELLGINNAVTRNLFMLFTKWRNGKDFLMCYSKLIASRVPLSWKKENINKSVKIIQRSLDELKEMNLIKDYNFNKKKNYETSYFQIYFDLSKHNRHYVKREKTHQENLQITEAITREKNNKIQEAEIVVEKIIKKKVNKEMYQKLIDVWCIENNFNEKDKTNRIIADKALKNKYIIEGEK